MGKQVHSSPTSPPRSDIKFPPFTQPTMPVHMLLSVVMAKKQIAPELKNTTTVYDQGKEKNVDKV